MTKQSISSTKPTVMTCHGITLAEYVRYIRNELPTQRYNEIHALLHESEELNDTLLSIKYDLKKLQLNHEPDLDAVVRALEREEERRLKNILDMLPLIEDEQALVEQDVDRLCQQLQEEIKRPINSVRGFRPPRVNEKPKTVSNPTTIGDFLSKKTNNETTVEDEDPFKTSTWFDGKDLDFIEEK